MPRIWYRLQKTASILLVVLFSLSYCLFFLAAGMEVRHAKVYWRPDYEKVDLTEILEKSVLTEEDYALLYRQTGLTKLGVDGLFPENTAQILAIQESYFTEDDTWHDEFAPFTCCDKIYRNLPVTALETGDILVSTSTHFSWAGFGHCTMVLDAEASIILNSYGYGVPSDITVVEWITDRPSLMILRPKLDGETRTAVADYAYRKLTDLPYGLFPGFLSKKFDPDGKMKTNCSHVVWYAYKKYGYDLDSNGGLCVFPKDIANSDLLEVVQVFGMDPETLWR